MTVRILQVDAFTDCPFVGNPAAVRLLKEERDAGWMQAFAAEMNLLGGGVCPGSRQWL